MAMLNITRRDILKGLAFDALSGISLNILSSSALGIKEFEIEYGKALKIILKVWEQAEKYKPQVFLQCLGLTENSSIRGYKLRIEHDFTENVILEINGFVLSKTEVALGASLS